MIENSTFSDLLAYAYNETGFLDSDRIQRTIDGDPITGQEYKELLDTLNLLNEAKPEVSDDVVNRILLYAALKWKRPLHSLKASDGLFFSLTFWILLNHRQTHFEFLVQCKLREKLFQFFLVILTNDHANVLRCMVNFFNPGGCCFVFWFIFTAWPENIFLKK